jgi:hypothetical protein
MVTIGKGERRIISISNMGKSSDSVFLFVGRNER